MPKPPSDQHHAQIKHHGHDQQEVDQSAGTDDPGTELGKQCADAPILSSHRHLTLEDGVGPNRQHERGIQKRPQDVGHREVSREERGRHADRQHGQPDQPVAEIGGNEKSRVGITQKSQHPVVADQGEQQRHAVDGQGSQVLAEHNVEVAGRESQQQLVGSLVPLLRPNAHRNRRDEKQHDEGEPVVELVEVGPIGAEEVVGPEGRETAERDEHANEHVAGGAGKVADEIPLED